MNRRGLLALPVAGVAALAASRLAEATPSLTDVYDVTDYGLVGNGVTDNLAALNALIALAPAWSTLRFRPGVYNVSDTVVLTKPLTLTGHAIASRLAITHPTADLLSLTGPCNQVLGLSLMAVGPRTGGSLINVAGPRSLLRDIWLDRYYHGITLNGCTSTRVENVYGSNGIPATDAPGGSFVRVGPNFAADLHLSRATTDAANGMPSYGVLIDNVGDLTISDSMILRHEIGMAWMPGSGQGVASVYTTHSWFDTGKRGLYVMPSGTGVVTRCSFDQSWWSLMSQGCIEINAPVGGDQVAQIDFTGSSILYGTPHGVLLNGGEDLHFNGGYIAGCQQDGFRVADAKVKHWSVADMRIGDTAREVGPNGGRGIRVLQKATDYYRITNNDLQGNALGGLLDQGTGTHKVVTGNLS